ncbi:MAG: VOC family protein [bacterium]
MSDNPAAKSTDAIPSVRYTNARAGIDWLVATLGADARAVYPGPDDSIAHAEVWFGKGCVMIGSLKSDGTPPTMPGQGTVYIVADSAASVDALHTRAVAAGARIVVSLRDTEYGSHDFGCADPEGNVWAFGTYAPV